MAGSSLPVGKGYTEAQWAKWFADFSKANPKIGVYTGDDKTIHGKGWDQVYRVLVAYDKKHHPDATLDRIAQAEYLLIQEQAIADGIGITLDFTGNAVNITGKSVTQGIDSIFAGPLGSITAFLADLTSANLWIRAAKILLGGAMLIVGLAKMTGADKAAGSIAGKAVKAAPLL